MGVKDLWTVLEPVGEHCTMDDLRGKRLAVDISGWIFQSLQSPVLTKKPTLRPHLRNLFWRLHHLMRNQVRIIVVFDGPSPKLKSVALAKRAVARRQQREKGQVEPEPEVDLDSIPISEAKAFRPMNTASDTYFGTYCTDCKEMLRVFRIPYVVSSGDAESTCAYLNRLGLVDGCITDDNDAFLFGAKVVYRHYTCDKKRLENLRCYRSQCIEEQLGLTQEHLIAMGLILGCDYGLVGIKGIGKERALEVLQSWGPEINPLQRLKDWRHDSDLAMLAKFDPLLKPEHCRACGHLGNIVDHKTVGCNGCARQGRACTRVDTDVWDCSCEWHQQHLKFKKKQVEIKIMKAAVEDINFPDKDIIESYKQECPDEYPGEFVWSRPNYAELQRFLSRLFSWDKDKVREKMAMYFTAFDLMAIKNGEMSYEYSSQPERIIAKRVENGQHMFEVEWRSVPDLPLGPVTDENASGHIITREMKDLFLAVFPEVVTQYEEDLAAKKNKKKGSRKKKNEDEGQGSDADEETAEKKTPRRRRKKIKVGEHEETSDGEIVERKTPSRKRKKKTEQDEEALAENVGLETEAKIKKTPRKRKTKIDIDEKLQTIDMFLTESVAQRPKRTRKIVDYGEDDRIIIDNEEEDVKGAAAEVQETIVNGCKDDKPDVEDALTFDNLPTEILEQSDLCETPVTGKQLNDCCAVRQLMDMDFSDFGNYSVTDVHEEIKMEDRDVARKLSFDQSV